MAEQKKERIVVRFSNHHGKDFITEHKRIINEYGSVWMLKTGRPPKRERLSCVQGQNLILCSPKADGNKMYMCFVKNNYIGKAKDFFKFPSYYQSLIDEYEIDALSGTWFEVTSIELIDEALCGDYRLVSNNRKLKDVINETRTSVIYLKLEV